MTDWNYDPLDPSMMRDRYQATRPPIDWEWLRAAIVRPLGSFGPFDLVEIRGDFVRDTRAIDYCEGGNPARYPFLPDAPRPLLVVDERLEVEDQVATAHHEATEYLAMRYEGLTYDDAHTLRANPAEMELRRAIRGGQFLVGQLAADVARWQALQPTPKRIVPVVLGDAIEAADEILEKVYGVVAKALNPLNGHDFDIIVERLARRLERVTGAAETEAVRAALRELDIDWTVATPQRINAAIFSAKQQLGRVPEAVLDDVTRQIGSAAKPLVVHTRSAMRSRFSLKIPASLSDMDEQIIEFARTSTSLFVRDSYGKRSDFMDATVRGIVARGMEAGLDSNTIGGKIAASLEGGPAARDLNYWRTVASTFSGRARSYAQIGAMAEAEIQFCRWDAVLDMASCDICRFMDRKTWSTTDAMAKIERVMALPDPEDIVGASPFLAQGKNGAGQEVIYYKTPDGRRIEVAEVVKPAEGLKDKLGTYRQMLTDAQLNGAGIMEPPAHHRCRCVITTF